MYVYTITKDNFQSEVMDSNAPVLLDFWASWCGPCRMLSPIIDEIASEKSDIKVGKINVDEEVSLAEDFDIMSIPTIAVMKDGKVTARSVGVKQKEEIYIPFSPRIKAWLNFWCL